MTGMTSMTGHSEAGDGGLLSGQIPAYGGFAAVCVRTCWWISPVERP